MKKLAALLLLLPLSMQAQKFGIQVLGGLTPNSVSNKTLTVKRTPSYATNISGPFVQQASRFDFGLRAFLALGRFDIGIGSDNCGYQSKAKIFETAAFKPYDAYANGRITTPYLFGTIRYKIAGPLRAYTGLLAGYSLPATGNTYGTIDFKDPYYSRFYANYHTPLYLDMSKGGVTYGVYTGLFMRLHHFGFTMEMGARRATLHGKVSGPLVSSLTYNNYNGTPVSYRFWYFPAMIGVRYTF